MAACMCTGRCRKPPYTCSGSAEPDFLTDRQRHEHDLAYWRGEINFQYPFEPWVVRSWARRSDENGWNEIADAVRTTLLESIEIANDSSLTNAQKVRRLTMACSRGRLTRNKGKN